MVSGGRGKTPATSQPEPPTEFANVPPQTMMLDHSFTLQAVMELQKSVAELATKTGRLIEDVGKHGDKIDGLRHQVTFVKGALWVIGFLILAFGAVATWYVTGKIAISIHP
jgi:hypothetical protein